MDLVWVAGRLLLATLIVQPTLHFDGKSRNYHLVTANNWGEIRYPYICADGVVKLVRREEDGDDHITIRDLKGHMLVAEVIPELRFPLPKLGVKVRVCGVSRYDKLHGWPEVHPVLEPFRLLNDVDRQQPHHTPIIPRK